MDLTEWKNTVLKSYIAKFQPDPSEVEHVLEFLGANPRVKISLRLSYDQAKIKAEQWITRLNKKNKNLRECGNPPVILDLEDGLKLVHLNSQTSKKWEGNHMGHCVASYKDHNGIYSVWDEAQVPHCTLEVHKNYISQIKGKANGPVAPRYIKAVIKCLKHFKSNVNEYDMDKLGYRKITGSFQQLLYQHFKGFKTVTFGKDNYLYMQILPKIKTEIEKPDLKLLDGFNKFPYLFQEGISALVKLGMSQYKDYNREFQDACKNGDVELVEKLLSWNIEINLKKEKKGYDYQIYYTKSPVQFAYEAGHLNIVHLLREKGAEIPEFYLYNIPGIKNLNLKELKDVFTVFGPFPSYNLNHAVDQACRQSGNNHFEILKELFSQGATACLIKEIYHGISNQALELLFHNKIELAVDSAVLDIISKGNQPGVEMYLNFKFNPAKPIKGVYPLDKAIRAKQWHVAQLLIDHGAPCCRKVREMVLKHNKLVA